MEKLSDVIVKWGKLKQEIRFGDLFAKLYTKSIKEKIEGLNKKIEKSKNDDAKEEDINNTPLK